MKTLVLLTALLLVGCDEAVQVPMDVVEKANELCVSMDGVKNLRLTSGYKNSKMYNDVMLTRIYVTCNRHNAKMSRIIEWEWKS